MCGRFCFSPEMVYFLILNHPYWYFFLIFLNPFDPFVAHTALTDEHAGRVVELFADVFANTLKVEVLYRDARGLKQRRSQAAPLC